MNESYDLGLPCKRPDICVSGSLCQNTKTHGCCWHEDRRVNKNIIYIDCYGDIDLTSFNLEVPADIHYCPSCRVTKETLAELIDRIKEMLPTPEEYQKKLTIEQKKKDQILAEKLRERQQIEAARIVKNKKKAEDEYRKLIKRFGSWYEHKLYIDRHGTEREKLIWNREFERRMKE